MSLVVLNGYIFPPATSVTQAYERCLEQRPRIQQAVRQSIENDCKRVVAEHFDYLLEFAASGAENPKNKLNLGDCLEKEWNDAIEKIVRGGDTQIVLIPLDDKLLACLLTPNDPIAQTCSNALTTALGLQDYCWEEHHEPYLGISPGEWERRGKDWKKASAASGGRSIKSLGLACPLMETQDYCQISFKTTRIELDRFRSRKDRAFGALASSPHANLDKVGRNQVCQHLMALKNGDDPQFNFHVQLMARILPDAIEEADYKLEVGEILARTKAKWEAALMESKSPGAQQSQPGRQLRL